MNTGLRRLTSSQPGERPGWRQDLALPACIAAVAVTGTMLAAGHIYAHGGPDAVAWLSVAVGPLALTVRRRHPVAVLWVTFAATLITPAPGFAFLSLIAALFTAAISGHRRAAWLVTAVGYAGAAWLMPLAWGQPVASPVSALLLAALLALLVVSAEAVRMGRERAAERRAAGQLEARRQLSEERLRMARELHDVIGHTISLINIQAGVGLDLMDSQPEQGRASLSAIRQASKQALDELRAMLAALQEEDEGAPRTPAPGLSRLPELVSLTRAGGLAVSTDRAGRPRPLPTAVDLAAYRIIQEALTNVARHAGQAAVTIRLGYGDHDLSIHIDDDGCPGCRDNRDSRGAGGAGSGTGIASMRARAAALGGRLEAGPRAGGGFAVHALLPLGGAR